MSRDHQFRHLGCKGGLCGGTVLHGADVLIACPTQLLFEQPQQIGVVIYK